MYLLEIPTKSHQTITLLNQTLLLYYHMVRVTALSECFREPLFYGPS